VGGLSVALTTVGAVCSRSSSMVVFWACSCWCLSQCSHLQRLTLRQTFALDRSFLRRRTVFKEPPSSDASSILPLRAGGACSGITTTRGAEEKELPHSSWEHYTPNLKAGPDINSPEPRSKTLHPF
jgi:hypothetical protein